MCFSSTCAMAAAFLQPGCLDGAGQLDDRDLALVQRQGDTTNAAAAISTLRGPGIQAELRTDGCIRSTTGDTSGWWLELAKCAPA